MTHPPTPEQQAVIDASVRGEKIVAGAFAGSGKTSLLVMIAEANPRKRVRYVAYNKSARKDAEARFPARNTRCSTSHGLAFRPMIETMSGRIEAKTRFMAGNERARIMGLTGPTRLTADHAPLAPGQVANVVMATIRKFCYSADEAITGQHVPWDLKSLDDPEVLAVLRRIIPPIANRVWHQDITAADGRLPMEHDFYLKAYALTHPVIPCDILLLDEAQDSNPCVVGMVLEQIQHGVQVIMTGDTYQSIYQWRGAVDAMSDFARHPGVRTYYLTQSFRFGPAIAAEAQKWLSLLGCKQTIRGYDKIRDRVGPIADHPEAILCRTNAEALRQAIAQIGEGRKVAFPKGTGELMSLVKGAADIKAGRPAEHPDLMAFTTWGQVQDFVKNEQDGKDLEKFVDLVDEHGVDELFDILKQIGNEEKGAKADITISTAHSAKGREWRTALIGPDFHEPKSSAGGEGQVPAGEARLAYVAVTRAQWVLNNEGLAWVDKYLGTVADDEDGTDGEPPAAKQSATMTITADPEVLTAIKAKIAGMFPGATVEIGNELAVAAG
jgi:AAA domain/UvrD-like helicase C-terminal domain